MSSSLSPLKSGISWNQFGGLRKATDKSGPILTPLIPIDVRLWQSLQGIPWLDSGWSPLKYESPVSTRACRLASSCSIFESSSCSLYGDNAKIAVTPTMKAIIMPMIM